MRVILSLLLIVILAAPAQSANVMSPRYSNSGKAKSSASYQIYEIRPSAVARYINKRSQKRLVYVYASWCPYCKQIFPEIIKMGQRGTKVIAVSVDTNPADLENYLARYGRSVSFPTMRLKDGHRSIGSALASAGLSYPGAIPYMAVIDEKDRILVQGGNLDAYTLWSYLSR